jgi:DNA-binding transcriptional ArsR family regulator
MPLDAFTVLADPTRREILDQLVRSERSVGELVEALALPQPAVSKHLKVLRDSGFVRRRVAAQQRIYAIDPAPLRSLEAWLAPYRRLWSKHLTALERHLDERESR